MLTKLQQLFSSTVSGLIHNGKPLESARAISDFLELGIKLRDDNPEKYNPVLLNYLHWLLDNDAPSEAAGMLWPVTLFNPAPQCTQQVWDLYNTASMGMIMGAGSMSKSFSMGVRLFLEYIRDPQYTSIKVIGPTQDHLEANLFSHLVRLHGSASLPMPGEVGELFIGFSRREQLSSIKGLVIPVGQTKKSGRLQGTKRQPRPKPHPKFGPLSRLFVFIDELENIPAGLWKDIDNILSQITKEGAEGFKIFGAYNPTDVTSECGKRSEPPFGWAEFEHEQHFRWKSTRGWDVLRLDGEKSENVIQGKTIYPGLQTREGLEAIAINAGGKNSPGYFSMGRGCYPPSGIELVLVPPGLWAAMRGEFIWLETPRPCGGDDVALEGRDTCVYTSGKCGKATGMKFPPSLAFPNGRTVMFKDRNGQSIVRFGIQADKQFTLPKASTQPMAKAIIDLNKRLGIRPEYFAIDRTGVGSGVADIIKNDWGYGIHDVNYSHGASETKLMQEDSNNCDDEYDRIATELWYGMKILGEFQYLLIAPTMDLEKLTTQVTQRKSRHFGKKKKIESKEDYMSRGHESPGEADSLTLMVHAARKGSGALFSMKEGAEMGPDYTGITDDDWPTQYPGGIRIDSTNRSDYLDTRGVE